jgi:hypothetical protein
MKRFLLFALLLLLSAPLAARAQNSTYATTVSACGTPLNSPVTGNPYPLTMDLTGKLCTSASGGSGGGGVVTNAGTFAVQNTAATPAGSNAIGSITNTGFGAQATSAAGLVGIVQADTSAPINVSTATTTQIVALSSGKKIYVTSFDVISGGGGQHDF